MSARAGHQEKLSMGRRGIACIGVLALIVAVVPRAGADLRIGHREPAAPAAQHFPEFFHPPVDAEWGWELGGFAAGDQESHRSAIIFVHGNNTDHATWYPVLSLFTDLGWGSGDLWGLAYNGVGCTNDGALYTRNSGYRWNYQDDRSESDGCVVTSNDVNVPDLAAFIEAVRRYKGSTKVHIVAHSLGVTLARKTLLEHDLYDVVDGFVAIAGANHGTSFCPPGSEETVNSCDEIAAGTQWLEDLNAGPNGTEGEAPEPTRWMTIYDGTGLADPAFAGPMYAQSPRLEDRAEYPEGRVVNCEYPGFYHNDLRVDPRIVDDYATFIAQVEQGLPFSCPDPPRPVPGAIDRNVPDPPQNE